MGGGLCQREDKISALAVAAVFKLTSRILQRALQSIFTRSDWF